MSITNPLSAIFCAVVMTGSYLAGQSSQAPAGSDIRCAVTEPNGVSAGSEPAWPNSYGNGRLAVGGAGLWSKGTVVLRPGGPGFVVTADGALGMKFLWQKSVRGPLTISGRRLDAKAAPLRFSVEKGHESHDFQPSHVIFPTIGCWEVTGRVADASLTFVTRVVKVGDGPGWRK